MELPENNNPDIKRVLVGIPLKGHTPPQSYNDRLLMAYYMGSREIKDRYEKTVPRYEFVWLNVGEIFVPFAREMLSTQALALKCDYLFMIDDDMMAPVDVFYSLAKHDVDLVAALAFTRNPPHDAVMFSTIEGFDNVTKLPYFVNNKVKNYPRNKLVECDAVGFGAVLIKTEIFKKMKQPFFMGTMGTGEDIHFCLAAKKLGFRVFMDTATKLGHLSSPIIVTEEYADHYNQMTLDEKNRFYGSYEKYEPTQIFKPKVA
jgi:hypothetical protein